MWRMCLSDRLLNVFLSYGEIEEGPLGFVKVTGRSRGFALFVYKNSESAQAALADPWFMERICCVSWL